MRATFSVKVILADRDLVEQGAEEILESAREKEVASQIILANIVSFLEGGLSGCRGSFWCDHTLRFSSESQRVGSATPGFKI